mmetsp:Transcript_29899/g.27367  ORF Transcript_29899/g.27367 Transcript_29899/m.27367 type:complete len:140 (-) Transcript_29899:61-480(-)
MDHYSESKVILSTYDTLYLDCGFGNYFGNDAWCNPMHTWRQIYYWEPTSFLNPDDVARVQGAEACQWSELNSDVSVMDRIFPRAASLAERIWSPLSNPYNDLLSVFERLNAWRDRANGRGSEIMPISAGYCEQHPDQCF